MEDKKIPYPQYGRSRKYAFDTLKKYGDSVFINGENTHGIRDAAYKYAKYNGIIVATRLSGSGVTVYHAGKIGGGDA